MSSPLALLLALLLASACVAPDDTPDDAPARPRDTDTAAPDDTAPPPAAAHAWAASFDAADLTVSWCGTDDNGAHVVAPGPDLDGDGADELAIGVAGHDGRTGGSGGVYVIAGSAVADGATTWDAATLVRLAEAGDSGFGARVMWVGDRDGDGVDDLLVGDDDTEMWTVSGAAIRAGGEVAPHARVLSERATLVRWADVDEDGRDDWLLALYEEGPTGRNTGEGAVSLVLDAYFTLDGLTPVTTSYGREIRSAAGTTLVALDGDRDGDGLPEFALTMYDDAHVISSAAFLAGAPLADAALTTAPYLYGHTLLAPGDLTGDGLDELVVFDAGNKLCVLDGADDDGSEKVCIRDTTLGSAGARLGDDLDGDSLRDVWMVRDGYLVAQDLGALAQGVELELARVAPPGSVSALATGGGRVWTSAGVYTNGGEVDVAWGYTASLTPERAVTLRGGQWGGTPGAPTWAEVTGDGVVDLLFQDATRIVTFDGAGLPAGGARTWCDATSSNVVEGDQLSWLGDIDDDGVDEVIVHTKGDDDRWLHEVWSGAVVAGLARGVALASWTDEYTTSPTVGCDFDGDGHDDLREQTDDGWDVRSGVLDRDGRFPWLGGVTDSSGLGCVKDIDGDGLDEVYTAQSGRYRLYRGADLTPDGVLATDAAWLTFTGGDWAAPASLRGADGEGFAGWWLAEDGDYRLCTVDLTGAAGELLPSDVPMTCLPNLYARSYVTGWLDGVGGDGTLDLVLYGWNRDGEDGVRVVDGATLGEATVLVATEDTDAPTSVGPGPDVLGGGGRAIWAYTEDADWADRHRVDVLYAHAAP